MSAPTLRRLGLLALCLLVWTPGLRAHVSGFTDSSVQISASGIRILYTLPSDNLLELARRAGRRTDSVAPPAEYLAAVGAGWRVTGNGTPCLLAQAESRALEQLPSYQYQLSYVCPRGVDTLGLRYELFFEQWPEHENFTRIFLADQRQRVRFTRERRTLEVPVGALLAQWQRHLEPGFFEADPNRGLAEAMAGREGALPRRVESAPSLGRLQLAMLDPGFIRLGAEHIFTGLDHVLFVLGLVLLTRGWRHVLLLVTAFTCAHSVTLGLSTLGTIDIPTAVAEPLIAFTILYIGLEGLWSLRGRALAATRAVVLRRAALVFVFGLVHGVGFSYVLRAMGLREDLLGALLYFNLGVELGQLAIVGAALPVLWLMRRLQWERWLTAGTSVAVAAAGMAMLIGRV